MAFNYKRKLEEVESKLKKALDQAKMSDWSAERKKESRILSDKMDWFEERKRPKVSKEKSKFPYLGHPVYGEELIENIGGNHNYNLYKLISDKGNLCDVYKASRADGPVVIKILKEKWREYVTDSFLKAVKDLERLDHENIVKYFDYGTDKKERPFVVMEDLRDDYVDLDSGLRGPNPISLSFLEVVNITKQLAAALFQEAHQKKIYHGCIKPSEVFYDKEKGNVKLAGFGLSDVLEEALRKEDKPKE